MHKFLTSILLAGCLLGSCCTPASAQEKAKNEAPFTRDGSTMTVPYSLAGIGLILVMVLVCMPARRE